MATDTIANMESNSQSIDDFTGALRVQMNGVTLIANQFNQLLASLGINTHKLLTRGLEEFTNINHIGSEITNTNLNYLVHFPLNEYAMECGYKVNVSVSNNATDKEKLKVKKRIKYILDKVIKNIKHDLKFLQESKLTFSEKVKGKLENFMNMKIIGTAFVSNGYIYMTFDPVFANYLVRLPLTQHSSMSRSIDPRHSNAYRIFCAMEKHYFNDNNIRKGTAQLLKVKSLLKHTTLPNIEKVRTQHKNWEERIKEPFEQALEYLVKKGLLVNPYKYCLSKGKDRSDDEASFLSYEEWEESLIFFDLKDAPDQSARIARNTAKIESRKKKLSKKKTATHKATS